MTILLDQSAPTRPIDGCSAASRRNSVVGQPVVRSDTYNKVTGRQRFMSDIVLPGAVWAAVVRSPHARADVVDIDVSAAQAIDGVVAIFTADDVPDVWFNPAGEPPSPQLDAAADKRLLTWSAQHVGDGIAVVVAATRATALRAARTVQIEWEVGLPVLTPEQALAQGHILGKMGVRNDEADTAFASADLVVVGHYCTPAVQHICLEPHGCAAVYDPVDGRVTIWSNTQTPSDVRRLCSEILGLPIARVRVRKINEGGGFGCKQELHEEALIAWLALRLGRPVQLRYTRREEFTASRGRHGAQITARLGFRRDGTLLVCDIHAVLDSGGYTSHAPYVLGNIASAPLYAYPRAAHRFEGVAVATNTLIGGGYRGYGSPQAMFAVEQAMDAAAYQLGIDPIELRRRNAAQTDDDDPRFKEQATLRLDACLAAGAQAFGWTNAPAELGEDGLLRAEGMAIAAMVSVTNARAFERSPALVRLNEDGTATLVTGTCDCGTGSSTVLAQIVAEELSIPLTSVDVLEGDTDSGLVDTGSFSQRSVYLGGGAARQAAIAARDQLLDAVARLYARDRATLVIRDGAIIDTHDAAFAITLSAFCREYAVQGSIIGMASYQPGGNVLSYGACFVRVAVDPETGQVQVERCMAAVDCGAVLNPLGAAGQVYGGTVQGLGFALIELWAPGPDGSGPGTIQQHGVPGALDVPPIFALFTGEPVTSGPYGGKGLGEVPIVPVAPAVANALARATGKRFYRLPLRPDEVWRCLQDYDQYKEG